MPEGMKRGAEFSAEELRKYSDDLGGYTSDDMKKAEELHTRIKAAKRKKGMKELEGDDEWFYTLALAAAIEVKLASLGLKPGRDPYDTCLKQAKRAYKNFRDSNSKDEKTYKASINILNEVAKTIERDYDLKVEDNRDKIEERLNKAKRNTASLFGELNTELKKRFEEDKDLKDKLKKKVKNKNLIKTAINDACEKKDSWLWWVTKKLGEWILVGIVQFAILDCILD